MMSTLSTTQGKIQVQNEQALQDSEERERRIAEELRLTRSEYQAILDAMPDLLFRIGRDGSYLNIDYKSNNEGDLVRPANILLGKKIGDFLPPNVTQMCMVAIEKALETRKVQLFEYQLTISEEVQDFEGRFSPITTDETLLIVRNITEQKKAQRELLSVIDELEVAKDRAQEASRLKSEFLATISHELRTPLNAIIGFSGIMLSGMAGNIDDSARNMVNSIYSSSQNLLTMINDILDLSKIEAGRMELDEKPFSIARALDGWKTQLQPLAQGKNLTFDVNVAADIPASLIGDEDRVRQIIFNLLSNAFKFTERGAVKLSLAWQNAALFIQVEDTGVGIPPHALDYIFDEFRQADASSKRVRGGTGLGLSIVRKLCVLMKGQVQVHSTLGQGSTFTVTLPLQVAAEKS